MSDGGNESVLYTAGIWGFLVLFGLALACWLLFRSMNRHLRGVTWREEDRRAAADATSARRVQRLRLPEESEREAAPGGDEQAEGGGDAPGDDPRDKPDGS